MRRRWKKHLLAVGWVFLGMIVGWLFPIPRVHALKNLALSVRPYRVAETTLLFQRLCADLLPSTPLGQHYLDLGYSHWNEMVMLLWYDDTMSEQTWYVIDLYSPAVEALLNGEGATVRVSQEMVDELLYFLAEMESRADPKLKQIIQEERTRIPWQEMVGLSAEEAWNKLQEAGPKNSSP